MLRGLYPIIDTEACRRAGVRPAALAEAIAGAGVGVAQYRHKGPYQRETLEEAFEVGRVLRATGVRPVALAEAIAGAGVGVAQYRHKGPYERETLDEACEVGRILRAAGVRYVINDRADVALMVGAEGVHLGQEDLPPARVRRMVGSSVWIGYSTHNADQLRAGDLEPVDYLAIGPVFPTGSKERPDPVVGLEALAELRKLTRKPLVAIGGITRANAAAVLAAGVDAVAVISDLIADDLEGRFDEWLRLIQPDPRPQP